MRRLSRSSVFLKVGLLALVGSAGCVADCDEEKSHQWPQVSAAVSFKPAGGGGTLSVKITLVGGREGWKAVGVNVYERQSKEQPSRLTEDDRIFVASDRDGAPWAGSRTDAFDPKGPSLYWVIVQLFLRRDSSFQSRWFSARFDADVEGTQKQTMIAVPDSDKSWTDSGFETPPMTSTVIFSPPDDVLVVIDGGALPFHAARTVKLRMFVVRTNEELTWNDLEKLKKPVFKYRGQLHGSWSRLFDSTWSGSSDVDYCLAVRLKPLGRRERKWYLARHRLRDAPDTMTISKEGFVEVLP